VTIFIDLDGDENNESKDLTNKLIEKELENINKGQNIINNMYSATDEALKSAQSKATMQFSLTKEIQDKILKDQQEKLYRDIQMTNPIRFISSKKVDKPPVINITHPPLVFPEQKKSWHETLIGKITVGVIVGVIVLLIGIFIGKYIITPPQQPLQPQQPLPLRK
jgi:hypothetical protein